MARINTHIGSRRRNRLTMGDFQPGATPLWGVPDIVKHADPPASHASASAGYHYEAAVPSHHTATPVAAPPAAEAATGPAGDYAGARRAYTRAVATLPAPLPPPLSPFAPTPSLVSGRPSLLAALSGLLQPAATGLALGALAEPTKPTSSDPAKAILASAGADVDPADPLGKKTLGDATTQQLLAAAQKGTLEIGAGGRLSTPGVRSAIAGLRDAEKRFTATSRPDLSGLAPEERAIYPFARRAHQEYPDVPVSVIMAQDKQESGFNPLAVSSADAFGTSQFIPSTAAAYGVKRGDSPGAIQSQVSGQAHLLHDEGFASDPQGALSAYSGGYAAGDYNNPILADAKTSYSALDRPAHAPPEVRQALKAAQQNAREVGVNPTPFNGDVQKGPAPDTVYVRADAQGMVHWAESAVGTQEGSPKQLHWAAKLGLGSSEPWCADFVGTGLARRGVEPPANPNYSGSYLDPNWRGGTQIGTDLSKAKPGDLVVFGQNEHIGLYAGNGEIIAGNYGNEVARYPASQDTRGIAGIVRPHYQGGKVAVHESAALPGSTAAATFASAGSVNAGGAIAAGTGVTGRPSAISSPVAIANPLAAGPVTPQDVALAGDEHTESAAESLITLLGEGGLGGRRPTL